MSEVKFPINFYELYFMAILLGIGGYVLTSILTCKRPYNLDRLLHRGEYSIDDPKHIEIPWRWRNLIKLMVGINPDYTKGDKIIAWSIFFYSIVYKFGICFVLVLVWNLLSPWLPQWWSLYFLVTYLLVAMLVGLITTVWFMIGGIRDARQLFRDLKNRVDSRSMTDAWKAKFR